MILNIPATDKNDHDVNTLLLKTMYDIANLTGYFGYITDDEGNILYSCIQRRHEVVK